MNKSIFARIGVWLLVLLSSLSLEGNTIVLAKETTPQETDAGVAIMDWSLNQQDSAIAYSSAANNFLVVWQHQWAINAYTVINGRLVGSDGLPVGDVIGISQTANNASAPSVAYNSTNYQFLVVWEQEYSSTDHDIYARLVAGDGTALGTDLAVSQDTAYESAPVVAYNSTLNQYMVAWVYHVDLSGGVYVDRIYAQRLDADGSPIGGKLVVGSSAGNAIAPHLVYNPASQGYLLVWCGQDAGGDYDIFSQRLLENGVLLGSVIDIITWENHQLYPRLAYNPDRDEYIVVWQDYHWDIGVSQVYGQRLTASGALTGGAIIPPNQSLQGNRLPDVTYQPHVRGFVVVWEYIFSHSTDHDIYRTLFTGGGTVLENTSLVSGLATYEKRPALASDASSGVQYAWEDSRNYDTTGIDIYGFRQDVQLPVFNGHVYQGEAGDTSTPLPDVIINLHCSNTSAEIGEWLNATVTDAQGAFAVPCYQTCDYYNVVETDPQGYTSVSSYSPGGVVKSANWLQFTSLGNQSGNAFWDMPDQKGLYLPYILGR